VVLLTILAILLAMSALPPMATFSYLLNCFPPPFVILALSVSRPPGHLVYSRQF
jgi:hypothetical protein